MIPIKLQIKNFLSYGADLQTIDFQPYHLICLSGKNGHGKSALLDAVTWAVWGQARKTIATAKADQGLLRLGQTQMMVCLDFQCRDAVFRIRREYMHTYGKPVANLDFGMFDPEKNVFIPLTGKTIRETQATIEKTLNLDFEAFINSAFLRQGQSNEFSKKSPKERKEVLASILALNNFDTIKRGALEKSRTVTQQKMIQLATKEKLEQEIMQAESVLAQLPELEKTLLSIKDQETLHAQEQNELNKQKQIIATQYAELESTAQKLTEKKHEENQQLAQLRTLVQAWRSVHANSLNAQSIKDLETQKQLLMTELSKQQERLSNHLQLKEQWLAQKEVVATVLLKLRKEYADILAQRTAELDIHTKDLDRCNQIIKIALDQQKEYKKATAALDEQEKILSANIKELLQKLAHRQAHEKQFEKRKQFYHHWTAQGNMLSAHAQALKKKHELVGHEMPSCPLCEQNLSASRRKFLKQKFHEEQHFLEHRISRIATILKLLKALLVEQHAQQENLQKQAQECSLKEHQLKEIKETQQRVKTEQEARSKEFEQLNTQKKELEKKINEYQIQLRSMQEKIEQMIMGHQEYQAHAASLALLEQGLKALPYDAQAHAQLTAQLAQLQDYLHRMQTLKEEAANQEARKQQIFLLIKSIKTMRREIATYSITLKQKQEVQQKELLIIQQDQSLKTRCIEIAQHKEQLLQEKGALENQRTKQVQATSEVTNTKKQIKDLDALLDDLQSIAQATGKDGVQALLIEQAIPEIEHEANLLLSKLTDNQTQLFIESLRDLKKGGTKETLDIRISDAVGIRPYEMFSGGEAFRIDFALRIAISKLLARRAGATLQLLIIDEGFGSQDEEGLSHIMDAIYKIQDDFAKIIIVSHLPAMKDQFPVHFMIEKGAQGSAVRIVEQG